MPSLPTESVPRVETGQGPAPERVGTVLLVSCYEMGQQPLSLALALAQLRGVGFAPAAEDLSVEGLDLEALRRAEFLGIAAPMHTALRLGVEVARRARGVNPGCRIAFFGLYASLNREYLLREVADWVLESPASPRLPALVASALGDEPPPHEAAEGGRRVGSVPPRPVPGLVPERKSLPPLHRYARLLHGKRRVPVGSVEATRGCLHHCLHCPIPPAYGGRFHAVPRDDVLADIRQLVEAGAGHISFADPDFLNGPTHSLRIARRLGEEFPGVSFDFTTKVEHVLKYRELFPEFRSCGGLFVVSAFESVSEEVLRRLHKGHTPADLDAALDIVRDSGLSLRPTFVPFTPWTSLEDYLGLLDFLAERDLVGAVDPVQYSVRLLIPPGSALLPAVRGEPWLGPLSEAELSYRWNHPDPRMDRLQRQVHRLVEAAGQGEHPSSTFRRIRRAAERLAGGPIRRHRERAPALSDPLPPRLTENWFC